MNIKTLGTVKYKGNYLPPGTEMDVEQEVADQLIKVKAAEALEVAPPPEIVEQPDLDPELNTDPAPDPAPAPAPDPELNADPDPDPDPDPDADQAVDVDEAIEELVQVKGVNKTKAKVLIEQDILSIKSLQGYTAEQLAEFKGISAKGAKEIAADAQLFDCGDEEPDTDAGAEAGDGEEQLLT